MPTITGSFTGKITNQSALAVTDQPNHQLSLGEVNGTQKSSDPLWNNNKIAYWAITDVTNGKGTQQGYFNNIHEKGRDFGTFEGKVTTVNGAVTVEGTWKFAGGDGDFKNLSGGGKFKTVMKSETDVDCTWEGAYELAKAQAR